MSTPWEDDVWTMLDREHRSSLPEEPTTVDALDDLLVRLRLEARE
jgi:hypothetical protein